MTIELRHEIDQDMFESVCGKRSSMRGGATELLGMRLEAVHEGSLHNTIEEEEKQHKRKDVHKVLSDEFMGD